MGTFVLGLGCQKGGTTWLHDYLSQSPQFDPGFRKEYRVLMPHLLNRKFNMPVRYGAVALERIRSGEADREDADWLHHASLLADLSAYYDYFEGLLRPAEVRATGDLTPAYSEMTADHLRTVRDAMASRGVRTKVLFVMRDPVDRIWSSIRMNHGRYKKVRQSLTPEADAASNYAATYHEVRSRYDRTLDAMDTVFGPDDVIVDFYERLFDSDVLRRICAQIGIDFHEPDTGRRMNVSKTKAELPVETAREIADHYGVVYDTVAKRFPDVDLDALWPSSSLRKGH